MLPAAQTAISPQEAEDRLDRRILVGLVIALVVYTLLVARGLLSGSISPVTGYLLLALACAVPFGWCGYGFVKVSEREQDYGLLLSAAGWALAAVALLIQRAAVANALSAAALNANALNAATARAPAATVCTALALLCLVAGALLSLHAWSRELNQ